MASVNHLVSLFLLVKETNPDEVPIETTPHTLHVARSPVLSVDIETNLVVTGLVIEPTIRYVVDALCEDPEATFTIENDGIAYCGVPADYEIDDNYVATVTFYLDRAAREG